MGKAERRRSMHENRCRFESQNASHMALFSASRAFCFQWITRHNANYAQMPGHLRFALFNYYEKRTQFAMFKLPFNY